MYDGTLCTRGPWQALVTFQQLLILADQDGNVDMTLEAISRRTTIPLNILQHGITPLLEPDPQSRTSDAQGRRIIALVDGRDWGWHIINYDHYRKMKREEDRREYHREYWHKRKEKLNNTQHAQQTQPNQPIAEAEAVKPLRASRSSLNGAFSDFWKAYPRKKSRGQAEKAWLKVKPDEQLAGLILQAVARAKTSDEWLKDGGQFIPYPATWLNAKGWEDEAPEPAKKGPVW